MATEVTRSLKEIREQVVALDKDVKALSRENRNLDRSLKLDPTSTVLLSEKTKNLQEQVTLSTKKVQELRKAQVEMQRDVASGKVAAEEYEKLRIEIAKAEAQSKSFGARLEDINKKRFDKITGGLKAVSKAATLALTSLVAFGVAYAKTGDEIQDASERYRISAEEYQRGAFIFDRATGDPESYKRSLETVTSSLANLAKGTSKAVADFALLGLSWDDLKGKSPAEALEMINERLSQIEDADERAEKATIILGNSGVYLAQVAGLSADELLRLNEELEKNGILSADEAMSAAGLQDQFDNFTMSLKKATAELGVALLPLLETLIEIASIVVPIISSVASAFQSMSEPLQRVMAYILIGLIVLPKVIAIVTAVKTAIIGIKTALVGTNVAMLATNKAAWTLSTNPIAIKILLIAAAVAALIILLVKLANWLSELFGGKKYEADVGLNFDNMNMAGVGGNIATGAGLGTNVQNSTAIQNAGTTVSNYYDYSTMNNTITKEADIDDIAEQLSTKIKVGGAR
jgi:hypothetical protein